VYSIQLYVMVSQCLAECPWFSLGNPVSMPWSSLGSPVSIPVVLSGLSDVNTGGSLWVLRCQCRGSLWVIRCQCRWFSLSTPVSMPVVLSGYSGVNTSGSLWIFWCLTPSNTYRHDIAAILLKVTSTTHTSLFYQCSYLRHSFHHKCLFSNSGNKRIMSSNLFPRATSCK
jgi:hypothetical protein